MSEVVKTKQNTISSTAVAINAAGWAWAAGDLARSNRALISSTQPVMATMDGTDPTATLGHAIGWGGTMELEDAALIRGLKFIRSTAVDALVTVTLLRD